MSPINLDRIQSWIDQGRIDPTKPITMKELHKSRCLHGIKRHGVKLLARVSLILDQTAIVTFAGQNLILPIQNPEALTTPIHIIVSRASAEAITRIESLGGSVSTRFYSPTSIKRVLRNESHPTISLQTSPSLLPIASPDLLSSPILSALQSSTATEAVKKEAMANLMKQIGSQYKYRLPDATGRRDIEYYRDPAHRGYLAYTMKEGESPSLFFKPPGEAKDRKKQSARRDAAKASADNKLF